MTAPVKPVDAPPVATEYPPAPAEEPLYEIVGGQRVELPPMSAFATVITTRIITALDPVVTAQRLGSVAGETVFVLDPHTDLRRRPDVAFISAARWPLDREIPEEGDWVVVPDLAVEVISPNDLFQPVLAKVREYFHYGVRQVWLVIPAERLVYVYDAVTTVRAVGEPGRLETPLLSGLSLPLAQLFSRRLQ
jgi:Uma2 family endonuclease